jgi:hypothetical protein
LKRYAVFASLSATVGTIVLALVMILQPAAASAQVAASAAPGLGHAMKVKNAAATKFARTSNMSYHNGPVMQSTSTTYAIFWEPATLQNGSATSVSSTFNSLVQRYFGDVGGSGLYQNNTQYYQISGGVTQYIVQSSTLGGVYVDTSPYPASACSDSATPGNCLSDAQIQSEVSKVMTANGWSGGLTHLFFVFTSYGEGSCYSSSSCAFTQYCAYHSNFTSGSQTVLYANMPYANTSPSACDVSTTPNGDIAADSVINVTSHEHMEAVTDPLGSAWYDNRGYEIGDKCAWNFGSVSLDGNTANVAWTNPSTGATDYYIVQQEWDNHKSGCTLTGP